MGASKLRVNIWHRNLAMVETGVSRVLPCLCVFMGLVARLERPSSQLPVMGVWLVCRGLKLDLIL